MGRKAEKLAERRGSGKKARFLLLLGLALLAGYYMGFRIPEEKRGRLAKLIHEGREMWFRLFV